MNTIKNDIKNKDLKRRIIDISYKLKLSHIGSCITAVDIIDEIYKTKKLDEKFILSAGHAHLAHLVVIYDQILKDPNYRDQYNEEESIFDIECEINKHGIHCDIDAGCDVSTGSLGHGLGIAVGIALADRSKNVYCLISDGECAEGSIAESYAVIRKYNIQNLKLYINFNGWGAYDQTLDVNIPMMGKLYKTSMNNWPEWLQGQDAHYVVMDEKMYKEALEVLK